MSSSSALLEVRDLHVFYGKIEAIKGISFSINEGEVVSLIGANGAGKTTTMRTISGVRPVAQGNIFFEGEDITKLAPHDRVARGICQAPQFHPLVKKLPYDICRCHGIDCPLREKCLRFQARHDVAPHTGVVSSMHLLLDTKNGSCRALIADEN